MATLTLDHLRKTYPRGVLALSDITIDIADGEFVVIVGPSGCGKSTLLRMVAGLESISAGELRIDGEPVNEREPKQRGVAMVFQNYALYPHMTNRQNIGYSLKLSGIAGEEIRRRVEAVAEKLHITSLLDRKPSELSGGQRQRVAMGRAIVREPKVFLFDEPLSNLDAQLRVEMRRQIKSLQRELKVTCLYVTHDQVEAMTMADRLIVLKEGKVQQIGKPMELYSTPANRFVSEFIGQPAMNIIKEVTLFAQSAALVDGRRIDKPEGVQTSGKAVLAIRPEHVQITSQEAAGALPFRVLMIEHHGGSVLLHGTLAGCKERFVVQHDSRSRFSEGEELMVCLPRAYCHAFATDAEGARLA